MKYNSLRIVSLAVLAALLVAAIPGAVYAADLLSISPGSILNNVNNTITVTGSGFDATAIVKLNDSTLSTTFVDAQTLTAIVPAGISTGSYTVTVSLSGGDANGFAILTVSAPPPTSTPVVPPFTRPQFAVYTSRLDGKVKSNGEVTLKVVMENVGQSTAYNTQAVFSSADLTPTKTGGVAVIGNIDYDKEVDVSQTFYVTSQITGLGVIVVDMTLTYYDKDGTSYSDKFTLSVPYSGTVSSGGAAAPTATPTGVKNSQLVITGYSADVETLQPGQQFALKMTVQNVGNDKAQRITMIVGGGSSGSSGGGTPQPGGVSGGGGDFANFAPVGASNVQSLGDLSAGDRTDVSQNLIVNVSTNPGAYPMRISFSYLNDKNEVINDEQVITLLVYSLPNVDVSFYRTPEPFFMGQSGMLPIQVVNLSKRLAVLGSIKIEAENGMIENGTSLVGSLDAGGYFTLDSFFIPEQSGTVTLNVTIDYLDDFNQPRVIERSIEVEVMEEFIDPSFDPSMNGGGGGEVVDGGFPPVVQEETVWQKIWRFILGLFGLDSSSSSTTTPGEMPYEGEVVPVQPIPGKGG